ncbi:MAG: circadian clock protein KaiB [Gammaproteobacteria bacterium]|nr:circadian clock protein KaiB [Gammaproteobacteria bacterium]
MNQKYIFQVFVAGIAPDTQTMIVDLKDQLSNTLGDNAYSLKVVDVLAMPQLAEEEHILATPTIVRTSPIPVKKIILNINKKTADMPGLELILED